MPRSLDQLPDDIETLKRLLIARDAEVEQQRIDLEAKHGSWKRSVPRSCWRG